MQEKIYLQLDNTCYFKGDTIWYKAYTLRADNLKPTDMSRILYVELLTPDGYLVERQQLVIDYDGASNGMFILFDSIYSGYYELRAYTKWNLNFNVVQRKYSRSDREWFYNKQLARDYYRDFDVMLLKSLVNHLLHMSNKFHFFHNEHPNGPPWRHR